ncbi:type IV pilin N-terminal domain-containing protein [Salinarchaeum laminariae]|uniref:type IV pilin N-terminal domain-containing protein n=1 Tax=Salinarchaeum laminariae TaxID=869888 RepID=UPI0020BFBC13|nr:type IV pilin N-terminal domain-containing protein [Salinarchaeum laminariae]
MSEDDDGLTREQFRWLVFASVGIGVLLLVTILGLTAASYAWGANDPGDPVADFTVETIDRDGGVAANITHAGGDSVSPTSIVIEVDGERRGTWGELGGEGPGIVSLGNQLVLSDVTTGDRIVIYWTGGDGEPTAFGSGTVESGSGSD